MSLTAAQYQAKACDLIPPINTVYELMLPIATEGGTFTIDYAGQETVALAYNASSAAVKAALEDLSTIGTEGVAVSREGDGPYYIELVGDNGGQIGGTLTADGSSLDPPAGLTPTRIRTGQSSNLAADAAIEWERFSSTTDNELRYLYMARELVLTVMKRTFNRVNQRDGQEESEDSAVGVNLQRILNEIKAQIKEKDALEVQTSSGTVFAMPIARGVAVRDNWSVRKNVVGRV